MKMAECLMGRKVRTATGEIQSYLTKSTEVTLKQNKRETKWEMKLDWQLRAMPNGRSRPA